MIKLIIEYDPINGHVLPDGKIEQYVNNIVSYVAPDNTSLIENLIGSVVMLDAFRVAVKENKINHKEIVIRFKGLDYKLDKNGSLKYWPEGLADTYDKILDRLLQ